MMTNEYFELCSKHKEQCGIKTIVLMHVGKFYEVYCKKETDENEIKKTDTHIKNQSNVLIDFSHICDLHIGEKNNILMAGFPELKLEKNIKKLQDSGYTVVVYSQDENCKNTTRSLTGIFSPGTYFQDEPQQLTNSISCVWIDMIEKRIGIKGKYVVVGIANIDIYTGTPHLFQFQEKYMNSPTTYDELERFVSTYNPSEAICISNLPSAEIDKVIGYAGFKCKVIHKIPYGKSNYESSGELNPQKIQQLKNCERQTYQQEIVNRFYNQDIFHLYYQSFYENTFATQAFCYLLDFIFQYNPYLIKQIDEPIFETRHQRLQLPNHSLKQLNIIHDGMNEQSKLTNVIDLLNESITPMGKRHFSNMLLNPTYDESWLTREYMMTDYVEHNISWKEVRTMLLPIKDMAIIERQIHMKKINPKSIYSLFTSIHHSLKLFNFVKHDDTLIQYLMTAHHTKIKIKSNTSIEQSCALLLDFIQSRIQIDLIKDTNSFDVNFICSGVYSELDNIVAQYTETEQTLECIRRLFNDFIERKENKKASDDGEYEYVKWHIPEKNAMTMVCTKRRCKLLTDALPSVETVFKLKGKGTGTETSITLSNSNITFKNQTSANNCIEHVYIEQLCKKIHTLQMQLTTLIQDIFNQFVEQLGQSNFMEALELVGGFITHIDLITTKCHIAKKYNYCKPEIVSAEKSFVYAHGLRHCLAEQINKKELYVSNDVWIGNGETDGILLYGTNMVGKTTLIRALGISLIMAQAGLYVPCSSFQYKPYTRIFTRIVANDNIHKGLSTFEVEMIELRTILKYMDENSLVLGDELCSGTETMSATSIFVAGIQDFYKCKCSFIFATHFHEIVDYEEIVSLKTVKMKHLTVKYDRELDMLECDRKIKDGPGEKMYGIEVCKALGFQDGFLENANNIRMKYYPDGSSMLSLKTSRYNVNKIVGTCEKCGVRLATEVHHKHHQVNANQDGIIQTPDLIFHKNSLANLASLCEKCHHEIHRCDKKQTNA